MVMERRQSAHEKFRADESWMPVRCLGIQKTKVGGNCEEDQLKGVRWWQ